MPITLPNRFEDTGNLLVPAIVLHEVFKVVMRDRGESQALQAIALMKQGEVVSLDEQISLEAAKISVMLKMPMVDSIIYATG